MTYTDSQSASIKKPSGEAGRRTCGGYNLKEKLDWDDQLYTEVQVTLPQSLAIVTPIDANSLAFHSGFGKKASKHGSKLPRTDI
jgi:hypothetical protein